MMSFTIKIGLTKEESDAHEHYNDTYRSNEKELQEQIDANVEGFIKPHTTLVEEYKHVNQYNK